MVAGMSPAKTGQSQLFRDLVWDAGKFAHRAGTRAGEASVRNTSAMSTGRIGAGAQMEALEASIRVAQPVSG